MVANVESDDVPSESTLHSFSIYRETTFPVRTKEPVSSYSDLGQKNHRLYLYLPSNDKHS